MFIAWALISVAAQIPAFRDIRRVTNLGGLLPNWFLFTADLLVRDLRLRAKAETTTSDEKAEWIDVPMRATPRLGDVFWHPKRRMTKALLDSADAIVQARLKGKRNLIEGSVPYRLLSWWVWKTADMRTRSLAFCVAVRSQSGSVVRNDIVFLSPQQTRHSSEEQ